MGKRRSNNFSHSLNNTNASKLTELYFLDLRNLFLNQENVRKFFQIKKIYPAEKNFLVPSVRKVILI